MVYQGNFRTNAVYGIFTDLFHVAIQVDHSLPNYDCIYVDAMFFEQNSFDEGRSFYGLPW